MSDKWNPEIFGLDAQDDGSYRPWRTTQQTPNDFELVPTKSSGDSIHFIPYLQAISMEFPEDGTQLCLMCHITKHLIFIEGRELNELAKQISNRRVKSIHVFDQTKHDMSDESAAIVTKISVEKS